MIIYEMHVRSFTRDPSSCVESSGTFLGIIEKIPHLVALGINAVELLPIYEFNERENCKTKPKTGGSLLNYWGYSPENFFTPMRRFGTPEEFKQLVKQLHKSGIEVILDVVYNHTSEGSDPNYYRSFRGIDNAAYYMLDKNGYLNYSGCGNTFNCHNSAAMTLILDSLRYWVLEYHIDGFRFDLAPILTRDCLGKPLKHPPLIEKITKDPLLGATKLIAEPWDCGGLYQVGHFPSWRFSEWNDRYRNAVRRFFRGEEVKEEMKQRILGSPDLYEGHLPSKSINFITIHDGFTLRDLVSYEQKHNEENGEKNLDGTEDNISWNCGIEGVTTDPNIRRLRDRQMRNFLFILLISQGIPMLLMGDEYGHTRRGNNNVWCQDNQLNYFLWDELEKNRPLFQFLSKLISFRKKCPLLRSKHFLLPEEVLWHPHPSNHFLSFTLKETLLVTLSGASIPCSFALPQGEAQWARIVDTSLPAPEDFLDSPHPITAPYPFAPHSSCLFMRR